MFRIEWLQSAMDELSSLWIGADSTQRQAITSATHAVEQRLQIDPANEGESRSGNRRITFVAPLAVRFRVEAYGQTVTVLHVRLFGRRTI